MIYFSVCSCSNSQLPYQFAYRNTPLMSTSLWPNSAHGNLGSTAPKPINTTQPPDLVA